MDISYTYAPVHIVTINMSSVQNDWILISYKNPNPKLTLLKEELSSQGVSWLDDPDPTQPLLERIQVLNIQRDQALIMGQMYSCEVWSCC